MLKMKKIIGILLALCFVLSVTAAAASAAPGMGMKNFDKKGYDFNKRGNDFDKRGNDFDKRGYNFNKRGYDFGKRGNDFDRKWNNFNKNKYHKKVWYKGHYQHKKVKKQYYRNSRIIVIYEMVKVWIPGYYKFFY